MRKIHHIKERIRWILVFGLAIIGFGFLYWGIRPLSITTKQLPIYLEDLTSPSDDRSTESSQGSENILVGLVAISIPERLRIGDVSMLRGSVEVVDFEATHIDPLLVVMSIDAPDVLVEPPGEIVQPLVEGYTSGYAWDVTASRGGVWGAVISVEIREIDPQNQWVLYALPFEMEAAGLLGLSGKAARWIGAGGLALSLSLGIHLPNRKRVKRAPKKR